MTEAGFEGFRSSNEGERTLGLLSVERFVLHRRNVAERLVEALGLGPRDSFHDREFELATVRQKQSESSSVLNVSPKLSAIALP